MQILAYLAVLSNITGQARVRTCEQSFLAQKSKCCKPAPRRLVSPVSFPFEFRFQVAMQEDPECASSHGHTESTTMFGKNPNKGGDTNSHQVNKLETTPRQVETQTPPRNGTTHNQEERKKTEDLCAKRRAHTSHQAPALKTGTNLPDEPPRHAALKA